MRPNAALAASIDVLMRQAAGGGLLLDAHVEAAAVRKHAREAPADARQEARERLAAQEAMAPLAVNACRTKQLADGTTGWCVRFPRTDDCWHAAVATVLQCDIADVPDSNIDERLAAGVGPEEINRSSWAEMDDWLAAQGVRLVFHRQVPLAERRWIGIVPMPGEAFADHSMVMSHNRVLFDPVAEVDSRPVRLFTGRDVRSGYSFQPV